MFKKAFYINLPLKEDDASIVINRRLVVRVRIVCPAAKPVSFEITLRIPRTWVKEPIPILFMVKLVCMYAGRKSRQRFSWINEHVPAWLRTINMEKLRERLINIYRKTFEIIFDLIQNASLNIAKVTTIRYRKLDQWGQNQCVINVKLTWKVRSLIELFIFQFCFFIFQKSNSMCTSASHFLLAYNLF